MCEVWECCQTTREMCSQGQRGSRQKYRKLLGHSGRILVLSLSHSSWCPGCPDTTTFSLLLLLFWDGAVGHMSHVVWLRGRNTFKLIILRGFEVFLRETSLIHSSSLSSKALLWYQWLPKTGRCYLYKSNEIQALTDSWVKLSWVEVFDFHF